MSIVALAGDVVTCAGVSLYGASTPVVGGFLTLAIAIGVAADALRAWHRPAAVSAR